MRLYLIDKLICPKCGHFPLSVEALAWQETQDLQIDSPCSSYCARSHILLVANSSNELPCSQCLSQRIISGELICPYCHSRYPIENGIPALVVDLSKWVEEEKTWWDKHYNKIAEQIALKLENTGQDIPGNRWFERSKFLFVPLRSRGVNGLVLEVGSGFSQYVAGLFPPSREHYLYVGTDVSRVALNKAMELLPEGDFVQCDVNKMPFRRGIFEVVICLGVLHHLPDWQTNLRRLIGLLRPGGWMLFDEAINKPRVLGRFRKQSLTASVDSPHEGKISAKELLDIFEEEGHLIKYRMKNTPLRVIMVWVGGPWIERSLF